MLFAVLGTVAGCSTDGGGDAGASDVGRADARDGAVCPTLPGAPRTGVCTDEGEVVCTGGPGAGCRCTGGCWSCTPDECWVTDTGVTVEDGGEIDGGLVAADAGIDASTIETDAGSDAGVDAPSAPSDAGVPATMTYCVDIFVANTCEMTVDPEEITIPADQTAYFCWRNQSEDYPVDVWLSYGGGYTDLAPGATWNEPPGHCLGPLPHDEYADITTACSEHRFLIHCL